MTRKRIKPHANAVSIRMYNVGFGDCFLLRIPTSQGERRMLVDCGFHSQGKGDFGDREIVERIKKDLDGASVDVVVATHRHQDHISGFGETDLWADVAVDEVWLPFTANPKQENSEPSLRAWHGLMNAASTVVGADGKLTPQGMAALGARDAVDREVATFMLWNARANKPAIENLLGGLKRADGRPALRRFLPGKGRYPTSFTSPALPDVTIHVLGPPTDPAMRKNRKVPSTWAFEAASDAVPGEAFDSPFSAEWHVPVERLPPRPPFAQKSLDAIRLFNDDLMCAAKALEGFLNGESLVLVLEIGSARILLTGDAEVGAWTTILADPKALELAASATFVKIGHHGSHNATPLSFVRNHLSSHTRAAISTQAGPQPFRNGIPLGDLLDELHAKQIRYARTDTALDPSLQEFTQGVSCIDCLIEC
jgi:beta-lactamase superfamily II metal-dependent hydrolase